MMIGRMHTGWRIAVVGGLVAGAAFVASWAPAVGACHSFSVVASPSRVNEGTKVTVTVSRDSASDPSSVDVETIDDTAAAGQDYTKVERTISFTNETEQSFDVAIANDTTNEGDETFKVHLSNPSGCKSNPRFAVGDDADVTIAASDAPTATAVAPKAPLTTATTAAPPGTAAATTQTTDDPLSDLVKDKDGGISDGAIIAAIIVALAAATAGLIVWRRRVAADGAPDGPVGRGSPPV